MKKTFYFLSLLCLLQIFFSCKKEKENSIVSRTQKTCRCDSTTDDNDVTLVRFHYDAQDRIITAEDYYDADREWVDLEYYTDSIKAYVHNNGVMTTHIYELDNNGLVFRSRSYRIHNAFDASDHIDTTYYEYNADGYMTKETIKGYAISFNPDDTVSSESYNEITYVDNNPVTFNYSVGSSFESITQYTFDNSDDKHYPFIGGFGWHHPEPFIFKFSKKSYTSVVDGGDVQSFTYEYNEDGYPVRVSSYYNGVYEGAEKHWYTCK